MPIWSFKSSRGALSEQGKTDLVKDITRLDTNVGLPAFFVNVPFFEMGPTEMFVGGESGSNFVNLNIFDLIIERFKTNGLDWEYFILDAMRQQWKINGMYPPLAGSEEKGWVPLNRPVVHPKAHLPSLR
ncbi:putative oxalocrotonate tautomerase enzyme-domain-containing protein [Aspergillus arachidicola]|uniref:Putative oxalocrotonate tautomerase enzyme-domain-containing protein n=1 Tax=Aspergillus arachidicola TaxID=656916 RepID=A0A2G7FVN2_9EURO|nr:putative oxalocrotonate tautomerase enzyme-domain-containing protein [Aspergillus arachidicola]PIG84633.1 hypothetical protein AARAC_001967 [Aspergillus arachidicola]